MRPEKQAIVDDLKRRLGDSEYALMVDYQGLSVEQMTALRDAMREQESALYVAKNAFIRVALKELDRLENGEALDGPTGLVTGGGEITQVVKKLLAFARDNEALELKGGLLGSDALSAADLDVMSKIPPREVLLGSLVGTIAAPMSGLVGVMSQKLLSLVYVLKAIEEKKNSE